MEKLIIIKTLQELDDLRKYIEDKDYIAFDVETTGTDKDAKIIGFSVSAEPEVGYYVCRYYWNKELQELCPFPAVENDIEIIKDLTQKQLIMHNAPFDCRMVKDNFGISLIEHVHTDTLILAHLLDENRHNGLKELGVAIFGESAKAEKIEMDASVKANGGELTAEKYELYKADADLIAKYGAKDAILTIKLFYHLIPQLYEQGLDKFFYEEESMPLLKGPTYELNDIGLRVDPDRLATVRAELEIENATLKAEIYKDIDPHVKDCPLVKKKAEFNISSGAQLSWLLYRKLGNLFNELTESGKEVAKYLGIPAVYKNEDKRAFIELCEENKGRGYKLNAKGKQTPIKDYWSYFSTDEEALSELSGKYRWVDKLLKYKKNLKLINTYVDGIHERLRYNIVRPNFLQHGTTSGRYSCKKPNFQNLPRDDKRIKSCIVSRPGKVFVGADYSQLEPRVFASVSQDPALMGCFAKGEDFYSVVGMSIFGINDASPFKKADNAFATRYPELRQVAKTFALATPYGTTASRQVKALKAEGIKKSINECKEIIERYFEAYPKVELMMLESHQQARMQGVVHNLYGRPRRIPEATTLPPVPHEELHYAHRTLLNLGMNHRVQSSAASIVNRASIAFYNKIRELGINGCHIVLQVHDEIVVECNEADGEQVADILKDCMENTTVLPGVKLVAEPKVEKNLADLK